MNTDWSSVVDEADFAFQSIVHPGTGVTFAVEALIRNIDKKIFPTIDSLFDTAFEDKVLFSIDIALREKAISKFSTIPWHERIKLFYNYDPRIFMMPDYRTGETEKILEKYNLTGDRLCFEISEKHRFNPDNLNSFVNISKNRGFKIALDDFGTGFSGLELLYHSNPDYIKFERFLISDIDRSTKKRSVCKNLIKIAKTFGAVVIAEGVETEEEFFICAELGFDLIQGYYTGRPLTSVEDLEYINIKAGGIYNLSRNEIQKKNQIKKYIEKPPILYNFENTDNILRLFRNDPGLRAIPVLDTNEYPVGLITDRKVREYTYSQFGYSLLINRSIDVPLEKFIIYPPVADINSPLDQIVDLFFRDYDSPGIIITWNMEYYGFIPASEIVAIIGKMRSKPSRKWLAVV
jgi:EAL domain-containing protein (putative c-di-GMP-specific phosphodiesterase class I)